MVRRDRSTLQLCPLFFCLLLLVSHNAVCDWTPSEPVLPHSSRPASVMGMPIFSTRKVVVRPAIGSHPFPQPPLSPLPSPLSLPLPLSFHTPPFLGSSCYRGCVVATTTSNALVSCTQPLRTIKQWWRLLPRANLLFVFLFLRGPQTSPEQDLAISCYRYRIPLLAVAQAQHPQSCFCRHPRRPVKEMSSRDARLGLGTTYPRYAGR